MKRFIQRNLITLTIVFISFSVADAQKKISNDSFQLQLDSAGITSLKCDFDPYDTDFILKDKRLGDIVLRYRKGSENWQEIETSKLKDQLTVKTDPKRTEKKHLISYIIGIDGEKNIELSEGFILEGKSLLWTIHLRNLTDVPLEIGDIALPLLMNNQYGQNPIEIFEKRIIKHHFISGHGSFVFWMRPNGRGPYLLMTPVDATKLEFFERVTPEGGTRRNWQFRAYIHSAVNGKKENRGTWRQPHTSHILSEKETLNDTIEYGFKFRWAQDYRALRDILYEEGKFDVNVIPGMTVPEDLFALFSLRTKNGIQSITPEYPDQTKIEYLGEKEKDTHIFKVKFSRLGENMLTVNYNGNMKMILEFFVTQPLETLIKKRSAFIVNRQQHKNPDKWYDGLFSQWDMRNKVLRGPDNTDGFDGWWGYVLACDDPGLCKAPFLAAKNLHYPDKKEIEAIEYYLEHFVWGKLQYTDKDEPYPYGIFGVPNWYENRNKKDGKKEKGEGLHHVWRTYDYPHIIMLYFHMYEIAQHYPGMTKYLDKAGYLQRAYGTAMALFTIPDMIYPVHEAIKWSSYNELLIINLIDALYREGMVDKADRLKNEWDKKVKYFIYDEIYPFRSEYSFDATAFESTYAFARYARERPLKPDKNLWYDKKKEKWYSHPDIKKEDAENFMEKQLYANLACRGWLETSFYYLGSDYRGSSSRYTLSYMSQMGGWAILDYALHYASNPYDFLRLGYASYLSSWALMNTGTPETNYGYWYPGKENDGASGWAFKPEKYGSIWIRKEQGRGAWFYDGEIDLGYGGALRAAATVVSEDPLFGLFAYGGLLTVKGNKIEVIPKDGLRKRFHIIRNDYQVHFELEQDGFAKNEPVVFNRLLSEISFDLENRTKTRHNIKLILSGLPSGSYEIIREGLVSQRIKIEKEKEAVLKLPISLGEDNRVAIRRK